MRDLHLRSARIGAGIWSPDDLDLALGLWGDPQVGRFIGGPFSPAQVAARLEREVRHQRTRGMQYWPLFLLDDGEHVGCCGVAPHHDDGPVLEFGFHLRRAHWGCGYVREIGPLVIRAAFDRLRAAALYAGHHPDNHASRRVLQSLGFRYTHDEYYPPTAVVEPCYRLVPSDAPAVPPGCADLSPRDARG
ncbi:MAG: GNAT family N-acetyltransferase [Proteobacteria bacterium]|nr:GNAT family N-acetyltransferase [Pseudomonadota bacterium]